MIKQNLAMVIRLASASAEANAAHYRALEDDADEAPADVAELLRAAMRSSTISQRSTAGRSSTDSLGPLSTERGPGGQ